MTRLPISPPRENRPEYTPGSVLTSTEPLTPVERLILYQFKRFLRARDWAQEQREPPGPVKRTLKVLAETLGLALIIAAALASPFVLAAIIGVSA